MLLKDNTPFRVLLPSKMFEESRDKEHFKQLLAAYMKSYPNYTVKAVKEQMAICERND
jgi:hypothetical protein